MFHIPANTSLSHKIVFCCLSPILSLAVKLKSLTKCLKFTKTYLCGWNIYMTTFLQKHWKNEITHWRTFAQILYSIYHYHHLNDYRPRSYNIRWWVIRVSTQVTSSNHHNFCTALRHWLSLLYGDTPLAYELLLEVILLWLRPKNWVIKSRLYFKFVKIIFILYHW